MILYACVIQYSFNNVTLQNSAKLKAAINSSPLKRCQETLRGDGLGLEAKPMLSC